MSQENVELTERAIAAINARDIEGYVACRTEDVELRTPLAPVGGVYNGPDGSKRFLADVEDTSPDFRIHLQDAEAVGGDRVLAFLRISSTGRASGIDLAAETANEYDFAHGKISRIRIFVDRQQALEAAGQAE
jgi:ketosteroid isomerase-like protein